MLKQEAGASRDNHDNRDGNRSRDDKANANDHRGSKDAVSFRKMMEHTNGRTAPTIGETRTATTVTKKSIQSPGPSSQGSNANMKS
jgi:hypothetical protein